jgi:hypothetical protein
MPLAAGTHSGRPYRPQHREIPHTPKCGKFVKLSAHGTKVLLFIPHHFHPYTLKDIWLVFVLDLVS